MTFEIYLKKIKKIYKTLTPQKQGELIIVVTNEEIIYRLKEIPNIKELTGIGMLHQQLLVESTSTSKKHELIKYMFENDRTKCDKIKKHGLSITTLKISFEIMFNYVKMDKTILEKNPEFLV